MKLLQALALTTLVISMFSIAEFTAAADTAYLDCPTFFTLDRSNVTGNAYLGSPAQPSCESTKVILCYDDGIGTYTEVPTVEPLSGGPCNIPPNGVTGRWTWNASTGVKGAYNFTMYVGGASGAAVTCTDAQAAANLPDSHPEISKCTVQRASFKNSVTIPDFNILLLPLVAAAGLFILRREAQAGKGARKEKRGK